MGFSSSQGEGAFENIGHLRDVPTDALSVSTFGNSISGKSVSGGVGATLNSGISDHGNRILFALAEAPSHRAAVFARAPKRGKHGRDDSPRSFRSTPSEITQVAPGQPRASPGPKSIAFLDRKKPDVEELPLGNRNGPRPICRLAFERGSRTPTRGVELAADIANGRQRLFSIRARLHLLDPPDEPGEQDDHAKCDGRKQKRRLIEPSHAGNREETAASPPHRFARPAPVPRRRTFPEQSASSWRATTHSRSKRLARCYCRAKRCTATYAHQMAATLRRAPIVRRAYGNGSIPLRSR